jgi:hypothetical protein
MDVHKNARLTFACRVLLVERIQSGRPKVQLRVNWVSRARLRRNG